MAFDTNSISYRFKKKKKKKKKEKKYICMELVWSFYYKICCHNTMEKISFAHNLQLEKRCNFDFGFKIF